MTRLARLCLVLVALAAGPASHAQERTFINEFAYSEQVGRWLVECSDFARQPNGKMLPYNACFLRHIEKPGTLMGGNALIINAVHGVERIYPVVGDRQCDKQPRARLVDDIYISNLPTSRQIELLRLGTTYSEEFMPRKWPECWIVVRKAPLEGFEEAYLRFREVARARGALW